MKTKISRKSGRIQTLAMIFTLCFTGIPVNPVWAGPTPATEKSASTAQAEKPVTSTDKTTTLRAPAFVGRTDLGDSTASPGPLSIVTKAPANLKAPVTTKGPKPARLPDHYYDENGMDRGAMAKKLGGAPSNTNFRGVAPAATPASPALSLNWIADATATKHLVFLKQAFTMGSRSSDRTSLPFYDGAGNLAATVYYKDTKIKQIVYAADPVNLSFSFNTSDGKLKGCGDAVSRESCLLFLDPKIISQDGVSPLIMDIAFYNSYASLTKFLETFYEKKTVLQPPRGRQMTVYSDQGGGKILADVTVDEYGEAQGAVITFSNGQVFTYGNSGELTQSIVDPNASTTPPEPTPPATRPLYRVTYNIRYRATSHLAYLKLAYTQSPRSTTSTKFFLDYAGHVAATVYYNKSGEIEIIRYADPFYSYSYSNKGYVLSNGNGGFRDPPMPEPQIINNIPQGLAFQNTQAAHTKFLDKFYYKQTVLRTQKDHQVTLYGSQGGDVVVMVDVEFDSSGKQVSATYTYKYHPYAYVDGPPQVFTYDNSGTLTGYKVDPNASTRPAVNPIPQSTPAVTVPDFLWNKDAAAHYDYLRQAYRVSSPGNTTIFKDGAGKVQATVYYHGSMSLGKIKAIVYRDSAYAFFYAPYTFFDNFGERIPKGKFMGCKDPGLWDDGTGAVCYAPPMTPSFSTTDASKLNASTLTGPLFYKTRKDHTTFLDTFYQKQTGSSSDVKVKVTEYYDKETGTTLVAALREEYSADVTSPDAKLLGATYTYAVTGQVFTYDSRPNKPDKLTGYIGPKE